MRNVYVAISSKREEKKLNRKYPKCQSRKRKINRTQFTTYTIQSATDICHLAKSALHTSEIPFGFCHAIRHVVDVGKFVYSSLLSMPSPEQSNQMLEQWHSMRKGFEFCLFFRNQFYCFIFVFRLETSVIMSHDYFQFSLHSHTVPNKRYTSTSNVFRVFFSLLLLFDVVFLHTDEWRINIFFFCDANTFWHLPLTNATNFRPMISWMMSVSVCVY